MVVLVLIFFLVIFVLVLVLVLVLLRSVEYPLKPAVQLIVLSIRSAGLTNVQANLANELGVCAREF